MDKGEKVGWLQKGTDAAWVFRIVEHRVSHTHGKAESGVLLLGDGTGEKRAKGARRGPRFALISAVTPHFRRLQPDSPCHRLLGSFFASLMVRVLSNIRPFPPGTARGVGADEVGGDAWIRLLRLFPLSRVQRPSVFR